MSLNVPSLHILLKDFIWFLSTCNNSITKSYSLFSAVMTKLTRCDLDFFGYDRLSLLQMLIGYAMVRDDEFPIFGCRDYHKGRPGTHRGLNSGLWVTFVILSPSLIRYL